MSDVPFSSKSEKSSFSRVQLHGDPQQTPSDLEVGIALGVQDGNVATRSYSKDELQQVALPVLGISFQDQIEIPPKTLAYSTAFGYLKHRNHWMGLLRVVGDV